MPEQLMPQAMAVLVATTFVGCVVSAVVGAAVAQIRSAREGRDHAQEVDRAKQAAIEKGVRTLLRNEIVAMHREFVEDKREITLEALEYAEDTYTAYHDLGGNGSGTKLWQDIKDLPTKE